MISRGQDIGAGSQELGDGFFIYSGPAGGVLRINNTKIDALLPLQPGIEVDKSLPARFPDNIAHHQYFQGISHCFY